MTAPIIRKHDMAFVRKTAEKLGVKPDEAFAHICARYREIEFRMKSALKISVVEAQKGNMAPYWSMVEQGWCQPEDALELLSRPDIDTDILMMNDKELNEAYRHFDEIIQRTEREKDARQN